MGKTRLGPLPLVVGVTGHIDVEQGASEIVTLSVRNLLASLVSSFEHSDIWVMTALAEGADQLVAETARSMGLSLVAVLPMPLSDYEQTLSTDAARQCLHKLWNDAALRVELPWIGDRMQANRDELQYEQVGLVIAHFSHILLALWNGIDPWMSSASDVDREDRQGGTAHIVYLRAVGEHESSVFGRSPVFPYVHTKLYPVERGLTFRIATPRQSAQGCVGETGSLWLRTGENSEIEIEADKVKATLKIGHGGRAVFHPMEEDAPKALEAAKVELAKLDEANDLLARIAGTYAQSVAHSADRLLPGDTVRMLGAQSLPASAIRQAHAMADVFSQANQRSVYWALLGIILALLGGVLTYELYVHGNKSMLRIYFAMVTVPAIVWVIIRPREWQNHFQDFRALAEALRVQLFWGLSGISCGVQDFYMRKHQDEMSWIRAALRGPALYALSMGLGPIERELVTRHWIQNQFDYFNGTGRQARGPGKAEYNKEKRERYERLATISYVAGACIAALLLVAELTHFEVAASLHKVTVTLMGFAPALAGAFSIFAEKRAFKDHAHQYSRMGRIFGKALSLVRQLDHRAESEFTLIVRDLGAEALAENGDWLISHRDRRVEPIKGG